MKSVAEFVAECLDGDWDRLAEIDPSGCYDPMRPIAGNEMLKCPGRNFDCDDCELARAVYRELWGLEAPQFRGDTMNSFRTALGREKITRDVVDIPWVVCGTKADDRFSLPQELRERIRNFHWTYHTIGNFISLPNVRVDGWSLNTYRAGVWKDSFGLFLAAVKDYLEGHFDELPPEFVKLMMANDFFWDDYKGDFERYVEDFFLEDYLDREGFVIGMPALYYWDKSLSEGDYIYRATHYLNFAERIIEHRAATMIAELSLKEIKRRDRLIDDADVRSVVK